MEPPHELYDEVLSNLLKSIDIDNPDSDEFTKTVTNLETFSKCRPPQPEPEPTPVPVTKWGRFKCGAARVWDNETTRVFIKAGGAFAGVAAVAYTTIHKDHVIERQAMAQANQKPQ